MFRKTTFCFTILVLITLFVIGVASADNTDVSLSVSVETSKSYSIVYRLGLGATIHNVTISGRLVNRTSNLGIPSQNISVYYKTVSRYVYQPPQPLYDSDWLFVNNTLTDAEGYYSYVWIPPITFFESPREHEVLYQVKVVWENDDFTAMNFRDVYISSLEYEPPPKEPEILYFLQPFLITGLFLSGATAFSIVIFNKFGGTEGVEETTRFDKKTLVYFILFLGLSSTIWWLQPSFLVFFPYLMYVAAPIILLLSVPRFFRYLRRGNKLKTVLSFIVIVWSAFLVLILLTFYGGVKPWVLSLFFPQTTGYVGYSGAFTVYLYFILSVSAVFALFLLLIFLEEETIFLN